MSAQVQVSGTTYVMRDFGSSPVARALLTLTRLTIRTLCLGTVLYFAVPSYGPTIPLRTIPNYTRIGSLATMVSAPETEFTRFISWVAPPKSNWDYFAGLEDLSGFDTAPSESIPSNPEVEQTMAALVAPDLETATPETLPAAFLTPDSFGTSGWELKVPDGTFIVAGRGGEGPLPTPEPRSFILFGTGLAGFALLALHRRRRNSFARQRV